jgi:la-related protein 6
METISITNDFQSDNINQKLFCPGDEYPSTVVSPALTDSTASSDSDAGYSTPAENFADDEEHCRNDGAAKVKPAPSSSASSSSIQNKTDRNASSGAVEVVVEPELRERIMKQVEWYFSDENLLKDSFLMKHINRNKQGYVSLKLVASLRKVKTLTKDWQAVLVSVGDSSLLALNDEETKIRRIAPAPKVDYSHVSRTIIITNYPDSDPTIHDIEKQFGRFGDVTLVRMLHPGRAIPLDVKPCKEQYPSLGKELCILVEYESEDGAKVAFRKFNNQQSWRDDMKVDLLAGERKTAAGDVATKEDKKEDSAKPHSEPSAVAAGTAADGKKKRKKSNQKSTSSPAQQSQQHHSQQTQQQKGRYSREKSPGRFSSSATPSPRQSRDSSPAPYRKYTPPSSSTSPDGYRKRSAGARYSPEMTRRTHLHPDARKDYTSDSGFSAGSRSASESPKNTPEPMKRFFSGDLAPSWRTSEKHVHVKDNYVVRQPHGPDGTRGFHRRPIRISVEAAC